jgi:hypothetical protein
MGEFVNTRLRRTSKTPKLYELEGVPTRPAIQMDLLLITAAPTAFTGVKAPSRVRSW